MKEAMEIAQGYYISNGLNFQKEKAIPCAVEKRLFFFLLNRLIHQGISKMRLSGG